MRKIQLGGKVQHPHRLNSQTRRSVERTLDARYWRGRKRMLCRRNRKWLVRTSLNRVINVPANIRLALAQGGNFIRLRSASCASQPRTIVDIITRLIKHYNCKSTEICHGRLRHCSCPRQTRLFHSLFSKHSLLHLLAEETTGWRGRMWKNWTNWEKEYMVYRFWKC